MVAAGPIKRYSTIPFDDVPIDESSDDDFCLQQKSLAALGGASELNTYDPVVTEKRGTKEYTMAMATALQGGGLPDVQTVCHGVDLGCVQMLKYLDTVQTAMAQMPQLLAVDDTYFTGEGELLQQSQLEVQNVAYALNKELRRHRPTGSEAKASRPQILDSAAVLVPGMRTYLGSLSSLAKKIVRFDQADLSGVAEACDFAVHRMRTLSNSLGVALEASKRTSEQQRLQAVFERLDTDRDGVITAPEFQPFIEAIEHTAFFGGGATRDFTQLFHDSDTNRDGCMCFSEFANFVLTYLPTASSREVVLKHLDGAENMVKLAKEGAEDARRITKVFKKLDTDGSGELDREEFKCFLEVLSEADASGKSLKLDVDAVMGAMDTDGDGQIDLDEFRELLMQLLPSKERRLKAFDHIDRRAGVAVRQQQELAKTTARLRDVFARLDRDGNGTLDAEEFTAFLTAVTRADFFPPDSIDAAGDAEIAAVLTEVDHDGNGVVDIDEFCNWVVAKLQNKFDRKNSKRIDAVFSKLA